MGRNRCEGVRIPAAKCKWLALRFYNACAFHVPNCAARYGKYFTPSRVTQLRGPMSVASAPE